MNTSIVLILGFIIALSALAYAGYLYRKVLAYDEGEDKVTVEDGITLIEPGEYTTIEYTQEDLDKITNKLIQIRNNLISL